VGFSVLIVGVGGVLVVTEVAAQKSTEGLLEQRNLPLTEARSAEQLFRPSLLRSQVRTGRSICLTYWPLVHLDHLARKHGLASKRHPSSYVAPPLRQFEGMKTCVVSGLKNVLRHRTSVLLSRLAGR